MIVLGKKILKKVKGTWVAVVLFTLLAGAGVIQPVTNVFSNGFDLENAHLYAFQSKYASKSKYFDDNLVIKESTAAILEIKDTWKANSVEDIKKEIKRQQELGLKVYVIHWGDTYANLVQAFDELFKTDKEKLTIANNLKDTDVLIVGDLLVYQDLDKEIEMNRQAGIQAPVTMAQSTQPEINSQAEIVASVDPSESVEPILFPLSKMVWTVNHQPLL